MGGWCTSGRLGMARNDGGGHMKDLGSKADPRVLVALIMLLPFLTGGDIGPVTGRSAGGMNRPAIEARGLLVGEDRGADRAEPARGRSMDTDPWTRGAAGSGEVILGAGVQAQLIEGGGKVIIQQQPVSPEELRRLQGLRGR